MATAYQQATGGMSQSDKINYIRAAQGLPPLPAQTAPAPAPTAAAPAPPAGGGTTNPYTSQGGFGASSTAAPAQAQAPAGTTPAKAPAYGSNISGTYDPNDPTQKALYDAGVEYSDAYARKDQAGMDAARAKGVAIRAGSSKPTAYNTQAGVTTFGDNGQTFPGADGGFEGAINNADHVIEDAQGLFGHYNDQTDTMANAATDPTNKYWDNIRTQADAIGTKDWNDKKFAYEGLVKNLSGQQKAEMDAILANLNDGQNTIQDKTFQDWLSARQNLASRGLSGIGAGFQQDANTRLGLNQQNAMGKLFASANQNIGKTAANYGQKLSDAYYKQAGNTETAAQQAQFSSMFKDSSKNLLEMAKMYAGLTGKQMPYAQYNTSDLLNTQFKYDQLEQQNQQFMASYGLDYMQMMGKNERGEPTLDANKLIAQVSQNGAKLAEQARHNGVMESIQVDANSIRNGQLQEKISYNGVRLAQLNEQLKNTAFGTQASYISNMATNINNQNKLVADQIQYMVVNKLDAANPDQYNALLKALQNGVSQSEALSTSMYALWNSQK